MCELISYGKIICKAYVNGNPSDLIKKSNWKRSVWFLSDWISFKRLEDVFNVLPCEKSPTWDAPDECAILVFAWNWKIPPSAVSEVQSGAVPCSAMQCWAGKTDTARSFRILSDQRKRTQKVNCEREWEREKRGERERVKNKRVWKEGERVKDSKERKEEKVLSLIMENEKEWMR